MNNQTTFNPYSKNQAIVKSYFKKPTVLIQAIIYTVSIALSLVCGFIMGPAISDMYKSLFSFAGMYEEIPAAEAQIIDMFLSDGAMSTLFICAMLPSLIITALIATAYYIIYFKSKSEDENSTPKAGFTILFVLSILNLISVSFAVLILLLCVIVLIIAAVMITQEVGMTSAESTMVSVVFSIMAIVFVVMGAIMLTYVISNFIYIKNARNSLESVELSCKGAGTYGVISLIFGIFTFLFALPTILSAPLIDMMAHAMPSDFPIEVFGSMGDMYLISGLMSLISIVAMIIDAVIALGYKKHIKNITNSLNSPDNFTETPLQQTPVYAQASVGVQATSMPATPPSNTTYQVEKKCPQCGTVAKDNDIFCNACGHKI